MLIENNVQLMIWIEKQYVRGEKSGGGVSTIRRKKNDEKGYQRPANPHETVTTD